MLSRKAYYSASNPGSRFLLTRVSKFRNVLRSPASSPASSPCTLARRQAIVMLLEHVQRPGDILFATQLVADPPCLRQQVMKLRLACLEEFLSHPHLHPFTSRSMVSLMLAMLPSSLTDSTLPAKQAIPSTRLISSLDVCPHRMREVLTLHRTEGGIPPGPWYGFPPYRRTNNSAETEIMETAVETRMALEVRVT